MDEIDKRHHLDDEIFSYQVNNENKVFIFWKGKQVKVLKGKEAQLLLDKITGLDHIGVQLELAKITGNFRRGNER
ncbi:MAG: hypothetical protein KBB13_07985 [Anaerolineaceae bacterium]|jgi:hypothetical protein|nr:hypothetical protein [Anaerolineaceae bacterium]HOG77943.1 hypothetical protein [Anaerolineaceae bacterium]